MTSSNDAIPYLSIIIPTLNEARFLPHLLTDLTHQIYTNFEVIVVDAHSTDTTLAKARRFKTRLAHLQILTSPHQNVCRQRNLGAKHALGQELLFLDADDRIDTRFLSSLVSTHQKSPADIYTTTLKPSSSTFPYPLLFTLANIFFLCMSHTHKPFLTESCVGVNRLVFKKLSGFDPNILHGEGNFLVAQAIKRKYTFKLYTHLTYTYSTRRMEHDGLLRTIFVHLWAGLTLLRHKPPKPNLAKWYAMEGGSQYEPK